ncbi:MAG: M48 family peptidase, partial [Bacteroidales bacterium]
MQKLVFILIITIPVAGYLIERYLNYLNSRMWTPELPEKLKGICDENEYRKTQFYQKDNKRLSFWSSTFNLAVLLLMIIAGGFAFLDRLVRSINDHPVIMAVLFFGIIGIVSDFMNIPFSFYDNFVIEKKYGFNKMTVRTFITDHIKSWIIALLIGAPLLALITWFYYKTGNFFWIYTWLLIITFTVFI